MPDTGIRRRALPPVDTVKDRLFDGFAMSHSTEDEYAATVHGSLEELEAMLDALGFAPSLFSALKVRFDQNVEDGSWVWRQSPLASRQLHVVAHKREGEAAFDIYAHLERSTIAEPVNHYRKVEYDAEAGIEMFRDMLAWHHRNNPDAPRYEIHPPHHRLYGWALRLVSYVSTPAAAELGRRIEALEHRLRRLRPI